MLSYRDIFQTGNSGSLDTQIQYVEENFKKYDKILENFERKKIKKKEKTPTKRNLKFDESHSKKETKNELKKELKKWKSKEDEILEQILRLKSDMKKQLDKISKEKLKKSEKKEKEKKICHNCLNFEPTFLDDLKKRQPSVPQKSDRPNPFDKNENKVKSRKEEADYHPKENPSFKIHSEKIPKTDEANMSSVENLELDSIYGSKNFLRRFNPSDLSAPSLDRSIFTTKKEFSEIGNIKIDDCLPLENVKNRKTGTYDLSSSARRYWGEGYEELGVDKVVKSSKRCQTYDFDDTDRLNAMKMLAENPIQPKFEFELSDFTQFQKSELESEGENKGDFFRKKKPESDHFKINPIEKPKKIVRPPTAYEIRFDFKKKDGDLTLGEAFRVHKKKLKKKIDKKKKENDFKVFQVEKKFNRTLDRQVYLDNLIDNAQRNRRNYILKENNHTQNLMKESERHYDISPDIAFRKFIDKKKRQGNCRGSRLRKNSSKDLFNFSRSTLKQESSLSFLQKKENWSNEKKSRFPSKSPSKRQFSRISSTSKSRSPSIAKIRDPSLKQKIRKDYDKKVRKRNKLLLKKKPPKKFNPYKLLKGFEKEISKLKNEILNY